LCSLQNEGFAKIMKDEVLATPFKPNWIIRFFAWVNKLPIPAWLFYFFILFMGGAIQHLYAWGKGVLDVGQLNIFLALSWIWLVEQLFYFGHLNPPIVRQALDEIRPLLDLDDEGFKLLSYEFMMTPASPPLILPILGFLFGLVFAAAVRPFSEIHYAFPEFLFLSWGLTHAMTFVSIYAIIRQLGMVNRVITKIFRVDIYNPRSLYGLSRLTASIGIAIAVIAFLTSFILVPQHIESILHIVIYLSFLILALAVFVLPLTEINRRLSEEKKRLLKSINADIEEAFEKVRKNFRSNELEQMPSLHAGIEIMFKEKTLLETIPTWPWAPSTFRGFLAAVFSPLMIRLGQLLLERLIDS
jgi:hypothetical protein